MHLQSLKIANFKRISLTTVPLSPITILVGGNNSGKSCVLQAAHLAVGLLQSETEVHLDTFTPDKARYQPTYDFWDAAHGQRLTEGSPPISVTFNFRAIEGDQFDFEVKASRGAGEAIVLDASDREATARLLSDTREPFSIYVPGLAGIPLTEEFCVDAVLTRGIARGDANLYLRNVLLRITKDSDKLKQFNNLLNLLLKGAALNVIFDPQLHRTIDARLIIDGASRALDTLGTGVLQFVQILAYVVNFNPALLLLDEPDAHLHPNNQRMIAAALSEIVNQGRTQIVLATHSRTMLDAFERNATASFVWVEEGFVQPEQDKDRLAMLMMLGALDGAERFYSTDCIGVVLTEDTDTEYLETLLEANGAQHGQILIHSYRTSSQINAAILLATFINEVKPGVRVIIHRDRDFMTDDEVERMKRKFSDEGKKYDLFITKLSDIEHYFVQPDHLCEVTGLELSECGRIISDEIRENHIDLYDKFRSKRDEIKTGLYRDDRNQCPSAIDMVEGGKLAFEQVLGKTLIKKVLRSLQDSYSKRKDDLVKPSRHLQDDMLHKLLANMPERAASGGTWPKAIARGKSHA